MLQGNEGGTEIPPCAAELKWVKDLSVYVCPHVNRFFYIIGRNKNNMY